jgi:hypothetical protein
MEPVTILTFDEAEHAHAACQQLAQAGLHPIVDDESKRQKRWMVTESHAGFHVQVDKNEQARAEQILDEWGQAHAAILREAIHCPECGSSEIQYPQYNRKFKLEPAVVAMLAKVGLFEKRFYCVHCQYMWPLSEKVDAPRDILGWPRTDGQSAETETTATTPS